jgi:hypothetical protein
VRIIGQPFTQVHFQNVATNASPRGSGKSDGGEILLVARLKDTFVDDDIVVLSRCAKPISARRAVLHVPN